MAIEELDLTKDNKEKYDLLMIYGQKLFGERPERVQRLLKQFISDIVTKKGEVKYGNLINLFLNKETLLEELLDHIMSIDLNCEQAIIHRKIELLLDKYNEDNLSQNDRKFKWQEEILGIIKNKNMKDRVDPNYLHMLFKMNKFNKGITFLSEMLGFREELLHVYMQNKDYENILRFCENYGIKVVP